MSTTYTGARIYEMNKRDPWNGYIKNAESIKNSQELYKLHATGGCGMGGRVYVAIRADVEITREVFERYNLMR